MADRPILFSGPMVRALLDGRKTQTRRIIKPQPPAHTTFAGFFSTGLFGWMAGDPADLESWEFLGEFKTPISVGDRLWVRETWQALSFGDYQPTKSSQSEVRFAATDPCADLDAKTRGYPWRPSIFMPRWASRLTLTVTDVRVERLQDISGADAIAEGAETTGEPTMTGPMVKVAPGTYLSPVAWYHRLWDEINGKGAWGANPWVVAYTFTVERGNIDHIGRAAA